MRGVPSGQYIIIIIAHAEKTCRVADRESRNADASHSVDDPNYWLPHDTLEILKGSV